MRYLLIALGVATMHGAHAQLKHSLDFDDSFFKRPVYSRWMRDPYKSPSGFSKTATAKSTWPKLTSISMKGKSPYAILDGKKYITGQYLDEKRFISNIGENFVIVTEDNFDYELVIADPNRRLASEPEEKRNDKK